MAQTTTEVTVPNTISLNEHSKLVHAMINRDSYTDYTERSMINIKKRAESYLTTRPANLSMQGSNGGIKDITIPKVTTEVQLQSIDCFAPPSTYQTSLPLMFTPLPPCLDQTDFTYLSAQDALSIPSNELQMVLLSSYISHIHPNLPFLDVKQFQDTLQNHHKQDSMERPLNQMSFLLFQAVMFAGSTVTDPKILEIYGYPSKDYAEKVLFRRVRLLYDFDICKDRLSILQSLVLMSCTSRVTPDKKNSSHWLSLAISMAFCMGLHTRTSIGTHERQRLERRLWWCIFLLDRTAALNSSQEVCQGGTTSEHKDNIANIVRCRQEDCTTPLICLEDFNSPSDDKGEEHTEWPQCYKQSFIEKVILSWCANTALISQCGTRFSIAESTSQSEYLSLRSDRNTISDPSSWCMALEKENKDSWEDHFIQDDDWTLDWEETLSPCTGSDTASIRMMESETATENDSWSSSAESLSDQIIDSWKWEALKNRPTTLC